MCVAFPYKPLRMVEHAAVNRSVDSSSLPGAARKAKHLKGYFAFFVCLKTHEVFERFARQQWRARRAQEKR